MIAQFSSMGAAGKTRVKTLIVEDDLKSREAMARILEMLGFDVTGVATVADGLRELEHHPAHLILDLMLPDGNGMQILRHIRHERLPIRVAILSGADRPMMDQAAQLKPDALFTKPVDLSQLLTWLEAP